MIGVLITGFRRGVFSNEAGAGSAAIAHSAARVQHPVSEGLVSLLEPFIDTVIICTMTSLVLIFTGLYKNPDSLEGAQLTSAAFATVFSWFPYLLLVVILLFSFSTMVSWSYYGRKCFDYLFGNGFEKLTGNRIWASHTYHLLFLFCTVIGASSSLVTVLDFSDMMLLSLTFPNLIGLIIMSGEIRADLKEYRILKRNGIIRPLK
ncbi:MAG: alanine:cation symporter family protein, partial [Bacteroidales bacterium]